MERITYLVANFFRLFFGLSLIFSLIVPQTKANNSKFLPAISYIEQGAYQLAIELLLPIFVKNPSSFLTRYYLGDAYRCQRRYHEAAEILKPIFDLNPTEKFSGQTHVMLAEIYLHLGQLDLAFQQANAAVKVLPQVAESYYHLGEIYLLRRQLNFASSAFQQAVSQKKDFSDAYQKLGHIALMKSQTQKAVVYFQKMINLDPFDHRPHFGLIKVYQQTSNRELAERHRHQFKKLKKYFDQIYNLQMALADDPTNLKPHLAMAELHYQNQNLSASLQQYQLITVQQPQLAQAWDQLGRICMQIGNFETAISAFQKLIQLKPESLETYLRLSWIYTQKEHFNQAKQLLRTAIQLSPNLTLAYHGLAEVHLAEGNSNLALDIYEQIVKLGDRGPDTMIALGQLRIKNGQTNEALIAFQTAIQDRPNDSRPYRHIAQIYAETRTYLDNAKKFAQKAVELNPSAPELATLAFVHLRRDDLQLAEVTIRQALSQSPDYPEYQKRLNEILQAQNNQPK